MSVYLLLFLTFLKIGAVSFGGGYGMISLIREECLANGWLTEDELLNFIAVAESSPGPIAVNMATFVGSSQAGVCGALLATLGVVLPSFMIILLIANFFDSILSVPIINAAFRGIRVAVALLILRVGIKLTRKTSRLPFHIGLLLGASAMMLAIHIFALPISTVYVILSAALLGIAYSYIPHDKKGGKEDAK